jgi:membrane protease YdiL (CAAX protease family)
VFDFNFIVLLLINGIISFSLFVLALVYFFKEAKNQTRSSRKTTLLFSAIICAAGIINALMMRYLVKFPRIGGYDLNSTYYLVTNLIAAMLSFFTYILFLRTGQGLSVSNGMPGSTLLSKKVDPRLNWRLILIPIPFLIFWTFLWFSFIPPEPTDLALASTPDGSSMTDYIYLFFTASVLAPVTEEILYRHFVMGLFAKWFGSSKLAIILNIWLSSLIFAIAHAGVVTADWVKIVQIIPIGMIFGWINLKRGLEHSIISHSLFNTLIIPVSIMLEHAIGM